ncbi:DUF2326 domain-containing protein [Pseudidiomarina marina]|uniref:DUF2326 domain-containing protein n=1 Tax=Pseudidiomarina marina TaxID=502366 RepID=UPI00384AB4EF
MLKSIFCEKFCKKTLNFTRGLNAVVGDDLATNSIGKSTLLMLIDFVMGGSDFLEHNQDVVAELGHHEYRFTFDFGGRCHYFRRDTGMPDIVHRCNEAWDVLEALTIQDYRNHLLNYYGLGDLGLSFRQMCSPFSRIWGKHNLTPSRPLEAHIKQSATESLYLALKLFKKYGEVEELETSLKSITAKISALSNAFRQNVVTKIGKKKYKENVAHISQSSKELDSIRSDLALYATNLRELANKEVAEIKATKDELLGSRSRVASRLKRASNSLMESKHIQSKSFEALKKFFPALESEKLASVEEFHSDIARILRKEILESERSLKDELYRIDMALSKLDARLREILVDVENPGLIVDRVYELSRKIRVFQQENEYYDQTNTLKTESQDLKKSLETKRTLALSKIARIINDELSTLAQVIYQNSQKSPYLSFTSTNYEYKIYEDTGTGKAYGNLILFDLAVFSTTELPFLIHDSVLFKNVENRAVERIIEQYSEFDRQSFIAIDEVSKYSASMGKIVEEAAVVHLSDDHVLYVKDWRRRGAL